MKNALIVMIGLLAVLPGCHQRGQTPVERHYGVAVHQAMQSQIINPGPVSDEPMEGMEGRTAATVMQTHDEGYAEGRKKARDSKNLLSGGGKNK